jgi:serine/threonine protein kinase
MDTKIIQTVLEKEHLEVIEVFKESNTSTVLKVKQRGSLAVLKLFENDRLSSQLFTAELSAFQKLDRLYYAGRYDQYRYFIISYYGPTLKTYLSNVENNLSQPGGPKRKVFLSLLPFHSYFTIRFGSPQAKSLAIIAQNLIKAVGHLHKNGVLHQDLKLSNVTVGPKLAVELIDFGDSILYDQKRPASARPDVEQMIKILQELTPQKFTNLTQPPRTMKKVEEIFKTHRASPMIRLGLPTAGIAVLLLGFLLLWPELAGSTKAETTSLNSAGTDLTNTSAGNINDSTLSGSELAGNINDSVNSPDLIASDFPETVDPTTDLTLSTSETSAKVDLSASSLNDSSISNPTEQSATVVSPNPTPTPIPTEPVAPTPVRPAVPAQTTVPSATSVPPAAPPPAQPQPTSSNKIQPSTKPKPKPSLEEEILIVD